MEKPSNCVFDPYVYNMSRFERQPFVNAVDGANESSQQ